MERPAGFELAAFWARWSAEFAASRPRLTAVVRAAPDALAAFPEAFGDGARDAIAAASEPDQRGWRVVRLSFEHEIAAAHRLAGFGGSVEVLRPAEVRDRLVATANAIIERYRQCPSPAGVAKRRFRFCRVGWACRLDHCESARAMCGMCLIRPVCPVMLPGCARRTRGCGSC
ncbi:MAG: helix-turn-helix transcriptional regulator [Micromonosporaceae bacterium]